MTLNERFVEYVKSKNIGDVTFNQWEVTYVNQIPKDSVWKSPADWRCLFPQLPGIDGSASASVILESFNSEWHFEIPAKRGRLHVQLRHGLADKVEMLILSLTARGPVRDDRDGISKGLDTGRVAIVRSFKDFTSQTAHEYWGIQK